VYCCVIGLCLRCQMPGHIIKRYYNLQADFNKRSQYIHGQNCHAAPGKPLRVTFPHRENFPGLQTCNQFSIRLILPMSITAWLYVCRHGGCSFLCRHVTRSGLFWCGVPILQVFWAFFEPTCRLQNFDTCSADCRLIAIERDRVL